MPELPDVEVTRRVVIERALGRRIDEVVAERSRVLGKLDPRELRDRLTGRTLVGAERRGKHLLLTLSGGGVLGMHFGLIGSLDVGPRDEPPRNCRLLLRLAGGDALTMVDPRQFGRITLADSLEAYIAEHHLGPDALDLPAKRFAERLAGHRGPLKPTLMDQALIAGIGNVFADEILFQARLHPLTPTDSLAPRALSALAATSRKVLGAAIAAGADPALLPGSWLLRHRRTG